MVQEAVLPNGSVLEFPDETSISVIQAAVKRQLGVQPTEDAGLQQVPQLPTAEEAAGLGGDGFLSKTAERLRGRGAELADIVTAQQTGQQALPSTILQVAGKNIAGSIVDIVGEGILSTLGVVADIIPEAIKEEAKEIGLSVLNTDLGKAGVSALMDGMDSYKQFSEANPSAARSIESVVNIGSIIPITTALKFAGRAPQATARILRPEIKKATAALTPIGGKAAATINKTITNISDDIIAFTPKAKGSLETGTVGVIKAVARAPKAAITSISSVKDDIVGNTATVIKSLNEAKNSTSTNLGLAVEELVGKPIFTQAQLTQSPIARGAERGLRVSVNTADKFSQMFNDGAQALVGKLDDISTSIAPRQNISDITRKIRQTFDKSVDDLLSARKGQARAEFMAAEKAGLNSNFIKTDNFQTFVDDIVDVGSLGGFESDIVASRALQKQIAPFLSEGMGTLRNLNINEMQRFLNLWGNASAGKASISTKLKTPEAVALAKRGFGALKRDLDVAADGAQGEAGQFLKIARNNYRANSEAIDALNEHAIKTMLDGLQGSGLTKGENHLAETLVKMGEKGDFNALNSVVNFLQIKEPNLLKQVQRSVIDDAIRLASTQGRKATDPQFIASISRGGIDEPINKISTNILKSSLPSIKTSTIIFKGQKDVARDVELIFEGLKRLTQDVGGSITAEKGSAAIFSRAKQVADDFFNNIVQRDERMLDLLTSPEARKEILGNLKSNPEKTIQYLENLNRALQ